MVCSNHFSAIIDVGKVPKNCLFLFVVGGSLVTGGSKGSLVGVANLLGLEVIDLERSLTSRVMTTTKGGSVGTIIK